MSFIYMFIRTIFRNVDFDIIMNVAYANTVFATHLFTFISLIYVVLFEYHWCIEINFIKKQTEMR